MEGTPRLYDTLVQVLSQHQNWVDFRHLKTLACMMVGLIQSGQISLTAWAPYVYSRAVYAQSSVRRFARWLDNARIAVHSLYGPLIQHALAEWGEHILYLALDTSMLWNTYCLVRLSIVYRGRAVPIVWKVLEHPSSSVGYDVYEEMLDKVAELLPFRCTVVFTADRGFADTHLMAHLTRLGWHWRIRIKGSFWIYRHGTRRCKVNRIPLSAGKALFWHHVYITKKWYGPVHLALGRPQDSQEYWLVVSDEPTEVKTFDEYGLRFDIEENFLDDKSNGFQLESSLIRSANALERLCGVLAITTLYLVSQGTEVVTQGKRRWVDSHWFRGQSYLKIGWSWVKLALSRGYELTTSLHVSAEADPEPAIASKIQHRKQSPLFFSLEFQNAVA
jgi:predicted RNA binding protein YcfA (HicA-like mRNA interferase family)